MAPLHPPPDTASRPAACRLARALERASDPRDHLTNDVQQMSVVGAATTSKRHICNGIPPQSIEIALRARCGWAI